MRSSTGTRGGGPAQAFLGTAIGTVRKFGNTGGANFCTGIIFGKAPATFTGTSAASSAAATTSSSGGVCGEPGTGGFTGRGGVVGTVASLEQVFYQGISMVGVEIRESGENNVFL